MVPDVGLITHQPCHHSLRIRHKLRLEGPLGTEFSFSRYPSGRNSGVFIRQDSQVPTLYQPHLEEQKCVTGVT